MTHVSIWLNLLVFGCALAGFICLAIANERQGEFLLHRPPTLREKRLMQLCGWPLLALALGLCLYIWHGSIGAVVWLGWLSVAGAGIAFYLPWWPWQEKKPVRARPANSAARKNQTSQATEPASTTGAEASMLKRNLVYLGLLLVLPLVFLGTIIQTAPAAVLRADAVQGQIGPWPFTLAQTDKLPPVISDSGVPTKAFQLRFCPDCDMDIRAAYLKVRQPRSLRAAGIAFSGTRWTRSVEIAIPQASKLADQLWLTVEGKDGSVYNLALDFESLSPATAAFIQE